MEQLNLVRIFKALSNEQRLKLFMMIYKKEKGCDKNLANGCCKGIEKAFTMACKCLDLSRSTVSHHINELQNAGLISCTRKGQSQICTVNEEAIKLIQDFL